MKTLEEVNVQGKTVLVRVDYNVPLRQDENGVWQVESDFRIRASLPTLDYLREHEAEKIILISHLGRPKGRVVEELSLEPCMRWLRENGYADVELLENLRFDLREEQNSREFAEELIAAVGAEVFVQDGFAVCHRAHMSTSAMVEVMKAQGKPCVAGRLLEREIAGLSKVLDEPVRPLVVMIGGAKVADKTPLIEKFQPLADKILVGGKIAVDLAETNTNAGEDAGNTGRVRASNVYIAEDFDTDAGGNKLDIGPMATAKFLETLADAGTVLWNGALGKVEDPAFATSSEAVARYLGEHVEIDSVICGGDTVGFTEGLMVQNPELKYGLVSTGGGASLAFLLGEPMPGIEALGN